MLQHCASKGEIYIGGFVLLKFIELFMFVRHALHILHLHFIRRNITLGGYLDTRKTFKTNKEHEIYIYNENLDH